MYLAKKPLRFMKIVVILWAVFSGILSKISPFALFLVRKQLKKHDVPCKKTVTFCENCRFFAGGFFWNSAWNLTFCPIFCQKTTKKTRCTLQKNRYVLWKFSFFCGRFFLKCCLKSHLTLHFATFVVPVQDLKFERKSHASFFLWTKTSWNKTICLS